MRDSAPKVPDGVVERDENETLVTPLDVPFGTADPNAFLRRRKHAPEPAQTIFPAKG